jgi:hypothetical protein
MKNVILMIGIFMCLCSCKKDDDKKKSEITNSDYLPMKVGNYWVYQEYEIDTIGNERQTSIFDSAVITKDTLINSKIYYRLDNFVYYSISDVIKVDLLGTVYYRDSSKNLISSKGQIVFSEDNFSDTLFKKAELLQGDTIYWITFKMERPLGNVNTPAGIFNNLLNFKGTVICNPKYTSIKNPRYVNIFYAKEVGEILQSNIYVLGGGSVEKRLVRYQVNK